MNSISLNAEKRISKGKAATWAIRKTGKIPAILYGKDIEPIMLTLAQDALFKALDNPFKKNTLLSIDLGDSSYTAMIKEIQVDPVSNAPLHVDFYVVDESRETKFKVPLKLTGKAIGVQLGGVLFQLRRNLDVTCIPENLPENITLDITELDIGDKLFVRDIPKSEGIEIMHKDNVVVTQVKISRAVEEEEIEEEAVEGEEGVAEGEEAEKGDTEGEKKKEERTS